MINDFVRAGLVQPGLYNGDTLRFQFELLGSYPELLDHVSSEIAQAIESNKYDRIVATPGAIALGVCVSQKLQISLVYRAGKSQSPVLDLVGAYDVGHPTLMLTDVVLSEDQLKTFISQCGSVGLVIDAVYCLCADESVKLSNIFIGSITTLDQLKLHFSRLI